MIKSPYINIPIIIVSLTGSSATKGIFVWCIAPYLPLYIYIYIPLIYIFPGINTLVHFCVQKNEPKGECYFGAIPAMAPYIRALINVISWPLLLVKTDQGLDSRVRFRINPFLDQYSFYFPYNKALNNTLCILAIAYVFLNQSYGAGNEKNAIFNLMCVFFYRNLAEW